MAGSGAAEAGNGWQRARRPRQKRARRRSILEAAAELFEDRDFDAVSLAAVAERAGMAKSNLYRYFGSKEEIYLRLTLDAASEWVEALAAGLSELEGKSRPSPAEVAGEVAAGLNARPRLTRLMALLAGVLEKNVTAEAAARFKTATMEQAARLAALLERALPGLEPAGAERAVRCLHALVAGLWPMAHPAPPVAAALARPENAPLRVDFESELAAAYAALLTGLAAGAGGPG